MTITEALAEIKLINDKIQKKQAYVLDNLTRVRQQPDPLASKGGTSIVIAAEVQSIGDLESRLTKIRAAIMQANLSNMAECRGTTMPIYEWLVWKREVAKSLSNFYQQIYNNTKRKVDEIQRAPQLFKNDGDKPVLVELEVALPYMDYATKYSDVIETLNKLDGLLSLKNATITVDV